MACPLSSGSRRRRRHVGLSIQNGVDLASDGWRPKGAPIVTPLRPEEPKHQYSDKPWAKLWGKAIGTGNGKDPETGAYYAIERAVSLAGADRKEAMAIKASGGIEPMMDYILQCYKDTEPAARKA